VGLAVSVAAGLVIGFLRGGRARALAQLRVHWLWLPIADYIVQILLRKLDVQGVPMAGFPPWIPLTLFLGVFVFRNIRLAGMPIILGGLVLNLVAMAANGGYMPATPEALTEAGNADLVAVNGVGRHLPHSREVPLPRDETRLWPLSDIFITPPAPTRYIFSIGDIVLFVGGAYFAYRATQPGRRRAGSSPRDGVVQATGLAKPN
jgi:hypothetical protein